MNQIDDFRFHRNLSRSRWIPSFPREFRALKIVDLRGLCCKAKQGATQDLILLIFPEGKMPPATTAAPLLLLRALRGASALAPSTPSAARRFSSVGQAAQSPRELYRSMLRAVRS